MMEYRLRPKDAPRGIRRLPLVDPFFGHRYSFSPYQGCAHGCLYCDGRAEKYHLHEGFDREVVIRQNMPELLEKELPKLRERGFILAGSGVSDPYQPADEQTRLMEACAEVLVRKGFPAMVATKNSLVLRDIDIWEKVHRGEDSSS